MHNAEIIAIGSEMLTPDRVDTNSLFLTAELNDAGVEVTQKHVIGDDRERIAAAVRRAIRAVEFVIVSGGLGPTEDDVTRDAVALALDRRQVFNSEISDAIEERFRRMNRVMPEINKRQAMVIEGAHILANDRGTAPGQWIVEDGSVVMILPGPPHELKSMFRKHCLPRLRRIVPPTVIQTLVLRVAGMSESDLDQTISPIYTRYENPVTTVLAHNGDIQVHLRARCATRGRSDGAAGRSGRANRRRTRRSDLSRVTAIRWKRWWGRNWLRNVPLWQLPKARPAAAWPSGFRAFRAVPHIFSAASSPTRSA